MRIEGFPEESLAVKLRERGLGDDPRSRAIRSVLDDCAIRLGEKIEELYDLNVPVKHRASRAIERFNDQEVVVDCVSDAISGHPQNYWKRERLRREYVDAEGEAVPHRLTAPNVMLVALNPDLVKPQPEVVEEMRGYVTDVMQAMGNGSREDMAGLFERGLPSEIEEIAIRSIAGYVRAGRPDPEGSFLPPTTTLAFCKAYAAYCDLGQAIGDSCELRQGGIALRDPVTDTSVAVGGSRWRSEHDELAAWAVAERLVSTLCGDHPRVDTKPLFRAEGSLL